MPKTLTTALNNVPGEEDGVAAAAVDGVLSEGEEPRVEGGVEDAAAARTVEVIAQGVVEHVLQFELGLRRFPRRSEIREGGRDGRHGERSGADARHPHLRCILYSVPEDKCFFKEWRWATRRQYTEIGKKRFLGCVICPKTLRRITQPKKSFLGSTSPFWV